MRDPFYQQILKALEGHLDPQVFEECMGVLLRADFPGLVPVPGGGDHGFDGLVPDDEGAFPLVCTTSEDVERNLVRSLDSVLKRGWPARKAALATSQALTSERRLRLIEKAQEKGFKLNPPFDRTALASRLYRSSDWCKELLLLDGRPSPLSVVPATRRPLIDLEPIGRSQDLEWLLETREDRVLAGEPGSGKTHLVRHLMLFRGWPALFLVSRDFDGGVIRNAIGDLDPRIVVVDDAHENPSDLQRLARLRAEIGASFNILATTWIGAQDQVMAKLGVSQAQVRRLDLLTRDEIVEVFRQAGVRTDDDRLRFLVNQAANKPGLAMTIASLWLQDRWNELMDGTALSRDLLSFFHEFVGKESTDVLAAFSLGGDRGMTLEAVGEFLGLARFEIRRIANDLAAGGALSEVDGETLAVRPRELRNPLLRAIFFPDSAAKHPYRKLLSSAPSQRSALETLVNAKLFGVPVPGTELRELIAEAGSLSAWRGMACVSEEEAFWVLEQYAGDVVDVAGAALNHAGEAAILRLLRRAETASGQSHSHDHHPMRVLQDWVQELNVPLAEMVRRRKLLARVSKKYLREGGHRSEGLQGICLALSPALKDVSSDPGSGRTVTFRSSLLSLAQLKDVESIWAEVRDNFRLLGGKDWEHLSSMLWDWIHPDFVTRGRKVSEEAEQLMKAFAAQVLMDIAPAVQRSPGLTSKARELALKIEVDLGLVPDSVFELLFPSTAHFFKDSEQTYAEWNAALGELAAQWVLQAPAEVTQLLARYEKEAQEIGRAWIPRGDSEVCKGIADLTEAPEVWLEALLAQGVSGLLTGPFVERVVETEQEGWKHQVERFLELDRQHAWSAVEALLRMPSPPSHLLQKALARLSDLPQLLESLCMRRQIPASTLKLLLLDLQWELALTAAVGEWNAERESGVRDEVAAEWRSAILRAKVEGGGAERIDPSLKYWLGVILANNPGLAFDWLVARLRDPDRPHLLSEDGVFGSALSVLQKEQRLRLVEALEKDRAPYGFVGLLVRKDAQVYAKVLSSQALRSHHLEPLEFMPDDEWIELALLSLEAGHGSGEIAEASLWPKGRIRVQSGSGLEEWQSYQEAFALLEQDPRYEVQEIARHGQRLAAELCEQAKIRERQMSMHGFSS